MSRDTGGIGIGRSYGIDDNVFVLLFGNCYDRFDSVHNCRVPP